MSSVRTRQMSWLSTKRMSCVSIISNNKICPMFKANTKGNHKGCRRPKPARRRSPPVFQVGTLGIAYCWDARHSHSSEPGHLPCWDSRQVRYRELGYVLCPERIQRKNGLLQQKNNSWVFNKSLCCMFAVTIRHSVARRFQIWWSRRISDKVQNLKEKVEQS